MYVRRDLKASIVLWFCWKQLILFVVLSSVVYWMYFGLHLQWIALPFLPVGTIGTAVAFYIGFKNNSSYERLWEARKIWGSITSVSRSWGMNICELQSQSISESDLNKIKQRLIRRQINWCNVLRLQLRSRADFWNTGRLPDEVGLMHRLNLRGNPEQELQTYLETEVSQEDRARVSGKINPALNLLRLQISDLTALKNDGNLSEDEYSDYVSFISDCVTEQTSSERIKSFPFPRQYAYFTNLFVWIFLLLLPSSLVGELPKAGAILDWMVIPLSILISWIFLTMEQVADTSEDPFQNGINDIPLTSICRVIERDLLEMLGEKNLPEKLLPVADILM